MTPGLCTQREDGIWVLSLVEPYCLSPITLPNSRDQSDVELIRKLRGMNENAINLLVSNLSQIFVDSCLLNGIDAMCSIPHRRCDVHYRGVRLVAMKMAQRFSYTDATACLVRGTRNRVPGFVSITPVSTSAPICISHPEHIRGKRVLLLDDIAVAGSAIRAAEKVLIEAGAKDVVKIALYGMTVSQYVTLRLG